MPPSNYARRMAKLSAKIFGEVSRETDVKSSKVLRLFSGKPPHLDSYYNVNYYPRHIELKQLMDGLRKHGLFRDEHEDFKDEMKKRRATKGNPGYVPFHLRGKQDSTAK